MLTPWSASVIVRSGCDPVIQSSTADVELPGHETTCLVPRRDLAVQIRSQDGTLWSFFHALSGGVSVDVSATFWKPGLDECGLLEAIHRRTVHNTEPIPLSTRPTAELQRNFTVHGGFVVDLSQPRFVLSRTAQTLRVLDHATATDDLKMTGRDVREGLRAHIGQLTMDEYLLVAHRDYSEWAVSHHSRDVSRESWRGPPYVQSYYAVRVGGVPGSLIAITEAQYLYGVERLMIDECHTHYSTRPGGLHFLNVDQFRGLAAVEPRVVPEAPTPPVVWWRQPWKWAHNYAERQTQRLGYFVLKQIIIWSLIAGAVVYLRYGLRAQAEANPRISSRRRRSGTGQNDEGVISYAVRTVFDVAPRAFFDYLLAPSDA